MHLGTLRSGKTGLKAVLLLSGAWLLNLHLAMIFLPSAKGKKTPVGEQRFKGLHTTFSRLHSDQKKQHTAFKLYPSLLLNLVDVSKSWWAGGWGVPCPPAKVCALGNHLGCPGPAGPL